MELWNLYDKAMRLIGKNHPKGEPIPDGAYHLSVEIWPFDGESVFLTHRAAEKRFYPGYWECIGGSAIEDETFEEAAVRELQEELGITVRADELVRLGCETKEHHIVAVFVLPIDSTTRFSFSEREIDDGAWYTVQQLESPQLDISIVPYQFERYFRYVRQYAFDHYMQTKPATLIRLTENHPELAVPKRGIPHAGFRPDGNRFSPGLNEIDEAFSIYGDALYGQKTVLPPTVNNSLGGGSPLNCAPFPPIVDGIRQVLDSASLSQYPYPAGDLALRKSICQYLHQEGFTHKITPENIIFTMSTTHAFHLTLRMLLRPGDAVLFTSPTYGLFAFEPERLGGETRFLPLSAEDDWLVSPEKLETYIVEENERLWRNSGKSREEAPRIVAFFQENPHNPTGKVMGPRQMELVRAIAEVCRRHQVMVIDDLLYRDLGYDRDNLALPVASFPEEYQNTVTFLGLSKSYGTAGIRAGMIVADEVFIRGIRNMIFRDVDSCSHLNAVALASAFSTDPARNTAYDSYFTDLIDRYRFNFSLIRAAVEGIDSLEDAYRDRVRNFVHGIMDKADADLWLRGMDGVHFAENLTPESGFFCILDFTGLRGKQCDGHVIQDDLSLLKYLFHRYRINFITGKSMNWPNRDQIVARISFSAEPEKIVSVFRYMQTEIALLQ